MPPPSPRWQQRWRPFGWAALALLGLVLAAAISIAASRLSGQHIGLSSEPLTAGARLSPAQSVTQTESRQRDHHPSQVEPDAERRR